MRSVTRLALTAVSFSVLLALPLAPAALAAGGGGGGGGGAPSDSGPMYDPAAEYQKGMDAVNAGKWRDAARAFQKVTTAAPKAYEGWFMLGFAKANDGDLKGARKAYERAAKIKPKDVAARRELGLTLAKLGETEKAKAELAALQGLAAACAGACAEASLLGEAVKKVEAAIAAPAGAPAPQSFLAPPKAGGDTAYFAALSLANLGRLDEAWAELEQARLAFGPHPDVLTYQGYVRRKMGAEDEAEVYYRQALAIAPSHRGALEYYGELMVTRGDLAGARSLLARLEKACAFGCAEAEELRRWIAAGGEPS